MTGGVWGKKWGRGAVGKTRQKMGELGVDAARVALELAPGAAEGVRRARGFAPASVGVDPCSSPRG